MLTQTMIHQWRKRHVGYRTAKSHPSLIQNPTGCTNDLSQQFQLTWTLCRNISAIDVDREPSQLLHPCETLRGIGVHPPVEAARGSHASAKRRLEFGPAPWLRSARCKRPLCNDEEPVGQIPRIAFASPYTKIFTQAAHRQYWYVFP